MVKKYKINYKKDEKEFKSGGSVLNIYKGITGTLEKVAPLVNKPEIQHQEILDDFKKKNVTDYLTSRKLVPSKKRNNNNNNNDKVLISVKGTNDDEDNDDDDKEEKEKEEEYIIINIGEDKYAMFVTTFQALLDGGYLEKIDK